MGQVAGIEPIFLSSLPFLVGSAEEAKLLWEVAKPHYEKVFDKHNQVLLYASLATGRYLVKSLFFLVAILVALKLKLGMLVVQAHLKR